MNQNSMSLLLNIIDKLKGYWSRVLKTSSIPIGKK